MNMNLVNILVIGLIVIALYLLVEWLLGVLGLNFPQILLQIGAIILFVLAVTGRINLKV